MVAAQTGGGCVCSGAAGIGRVIGVRSASVSGAGPVIGGAPAGTGSGRRCSRAGGAAGCVVWRAHFVGCRCPVSGSVPVVLQRASRIAIGSDCMMARRRFSVSPCWIFVRTLDASRHEAVEVGWADPGSVLAGSRSRCRKCLQTRLLLVPFGIPWLLLDFERMSSCSGAALFIYARSGAGLAGDQAVGSP